LGEGEEEANTQGEVLRQKEYLERTLLSLKNQLTQVNKGQFRKETNTRSEVLRQKKYICNHCVADLADLKGQFHDETYTKGEVLR
jgi:hypothetical protein